MIVAHERSMIFYELLNKIRAVVFLGVPHKGSDLAYWATFLTELLKFGQLGFVGNSNFVAALKANSPVFASISSQSTERLQSAAVDIRTFYEANRLGNQLVLSTTYQALDADMYRSWTRPRQYLASLMKEQCR